MKKWLHTLVLCILVALCTSCASVKCVPEIEYRDSVRIEYKLDSVYFYEKDSMYVDRFIKGDTVFITKDKWHTRYKDKIVELHDTTYVNNEVVIKETEKVTPKWLLWLLGVTGTITVCLVIKYVVKVGKHFV